jgi:hypothetical protein
MQEHPLTDFPDRAEHLKAGNDAYAQLRAEGGEAFDRYLEAGRAGTVAYRAGRQGQNTFGDRRKVGVQPPQPQPGTVEHVSQLVVADVDADLSITLQECCFIRGVIYHKP